jgi:hypothetical protein
MHHVEAAWMENYVKTDQVRFVRFQGNRMTIRTPPFLKEAAKLANQELVWERMMAETPSPPDRN